MAYKKYEKYKDSGVEWIGEIPEGWELTKIKFISTMYSGNGFKEDLQGKLEGDYPFYKVSDINGEGKFVTTASNYVDKSDVENNRWNVIPANSILFAKIGEALKKNHRKINTDKCLIDNNTAALRPHERLIDVNYFYYLFCCINAEWFVNPGAVPSIDNRTLKNFIVVLPLLTEQTAIAAFLDQKTAEIDSLIADKEKMIQLLREKRQAIISEAVTKGLDRNVSMKDSGVEWIGEIPAHWKVKKIKHLLVSKKDAIKPGPFGSQLRSEEMQEGEIKVYNQRNVLDNDFISGDNYISQEKYKELQAFTVYPGDILVTTRGTIGKVGILPQDCEIGILHPCLIKLQVDNSKVIPEYLQLIFNNTSLVSNQLFFQSNATTIEVIYSDTLKNIAIPLPDVQEQMLILENINKTCVLFEELIKNIQIQIVKLKEYRQSLISEAVTGKIDVRDFTPNTEGVVASV